MPTYTGTNICVSKGSLRTYGMNLFLLYMGIYWSDLQAAVQQCLVVNWKSKKLVSAQSYKPPGLD